jgi:hypothetical protein
VLIPNIGPQARGKSMHIPTEPCNVCDTEMMNRLRLDVIHWRVQVAAQVSGTPLPLTSPSTGTPLLPQLLYDHLLPHRCWQTAAIIKRDLLQVRGAFYGLTLNSNSRWCSSCKFVCQRCIADGR